MAETVQQILRERTDDDRTALKCGDRTWTWRQHLVEAAAEAAVLIEAHDPERPLHVGTLLGNTPDMLRAMAAAGLGGYVLCGINTTRRGEGLRADVRRADCRFLLTDTEHLPLLELKADIANRPPTGAAGTTGIIDAEVLDREQWHFAKHPAELRQLSVGRGQTRHNRRVTSSLPSDFKLSASQVTATTMVPTAIAGKNNIHGAMVTKLRASLIIRPQSGVGG